MRAISVYVEEEEYQRLKSLASLERRPVAALIREALTDYLERDEGPGRSILEIVPHQSGRLLAGWTRDELFDESEPSLKKRSGAATASA